MGLLFISTAEIIPLGKWDNTLCIVCGETLLNEEMWNDIPGRGRMCDIRTVQRLDSCPHDNDELWWMAIAKIEGASPKEIRTIKNNPPEPIELDWNAEPVINFLEPEKFYEHYQNLAPTREEQKQWLAQLNTRLYCQCLIPSDFEYCDNCNFIYNPPPYMIYTIPEEEEPISSCALESKLLINHNLDSDDNNKTLIPAPFKMAMTTKMIQTQIQTQI
ncbi:hypothetical protein G9A89_016971 [Geosiphon pyriformis]|nr:hypothetical protein G9A89_016971 [Geosiphon pyriformis]